MKILFVCYANVCRSFMAQELCKKFLPQAEVFSRGVYADPSVRVPEKVWLFLQKNGVEKSAHGAAPLRKEDLEKADFIFFMEQRHLDAWADRYAQYGDKMWLLNDFAYNQETDVPDPISLSARAFDNSARRLLQTVKAAAEKLRKNCF